MCSKLEGEIVKEKTDHVAVRYLSNKKVSVNFYNLLTISILVTALTEDISEIVNGSIR